MPLPLLLPLFLLLPLLSLPSTRASAADFTLKTQVANHIASLPPSRMQAMLQHALTYLGVPYKWGGDDPVADGGFDCVGLAYALYHAHGLEFPYPRYSSLNMTPLPRGPQINKVWWTEYSEDFAQTMQDCGKGPFADGDVLIYHELVNGRIVERTGHAVLVMDAKKAHAISAARSGVRLHALGDLHWFDTKTLTGCWRAASALKVPLSKLPYSWSVDLAHGKPAQHGTHQAPYLTTNPMDLVLTATGPNLSTLHLEITGRVLSLIGLVSPTATELAPLSPSLASAPAPAPALAPAPTGSRQWHIHHDFKALDLPVDPGEHVPTPQRKIVARLFDQAGLMVDEKVFYVEFHPYWY